MEQAITDKVASKGLSLPGFLVGLATGLILYGIVEYWIDDADDAPFAITTLFFIATSAIAYLLLAEAGVMRRAAVAALLTAVVLAGPDYYLARLGDDDIPNLTRFPLIFWFMVSRPLVLFLTITLLKAVLQEGAPPPYRPVFFHGVTIPLIGVGAKVFAGLTLVLLFAWARLLKEFDVLFFNKLFQEPWFILPFLGAIGGLSIAMMRSQQGVLGALRFVVLLFCRIVILVTALFTVTLLLVMATKGVDALFATDVDRPAAIIIGLALAGMLIFNGVYQDGENGPPPLWLRIAAIVTLIGFPIYTGLAVFALTTRIEDYGLTPPRIGGLVIAGLVALYSIVCVAGLASELNWRAKRWMRPVAQLNIVMAVIWIVALTSIATPLVNTWAMSANSQYNLLARQKISAEEFDYGYLRFQLGEYGENVFEKLLTLSNHPEADEIRDKIVHVRSFETEWEYERGISDTALTPDPVTLENN